MPRQQVYGKRTRAIYDPRAAFSSPEAQTTAPIPSNVEQATPIAAKKIDRSKAVLDNQSIPRRSPRKALGEKQVNSVVLPLEAIIAVKENRPKKQGTQGQEAHGQKHKIGRDGKVAAPRQHTTFDDDDLPKPSLAPTREVKETESLQPKLRKPRGARRRTQRQQRDEHGETIPQPVPRAVKGQHIFFEDEPLVKQDEDLETTEAVASAEQPCPTISPSVDNICEGESKDDGLEGVSSSCTAETCPYQQHCSEILELSAHPLTCFDTWSSELSELFAVTKIAEASFGEVYRLSLLEDITDFCNTDESVFKVIPLQRPESTLPLDKRKRNAALLKNGDMSKPSDVATEVRLLQRMSTIPGFTNFRDVRILQGRPPPAFVDAFKAWNTSQKAKKKDLSHFPDPGKKSSYTNDQLWAVIEMQDAGSDLERLIEQGACTSVWTTWDIFWQTVLAIAKGEEGAEFEHRDLHAGNICIRSATLPSEIDPNRKLNFTSLETTIIDYTISRCLMPDSKIAYTDLSSPSQAGVFEADATEEYQYEIYRYMRGALFFDNAYAEWNPEHTTGRDWEQFHPQTNLVWLHLVLYKLLEQLVWPSSIKKKAPPKKNRKDHAVWKRARDLENVLLKVQDLLDPGAICENGVRSASDLIGFAVGEGWLDLEDVIGNGVDESALISQLEGLDLK
ncbi:putative serine/threonine-protein kinase haspin-like [Pseudocercospora fuligena]|uniref:non-specific serine/threonine protein kinase n=1 Tax=Pseudocercospora fuligena TaxID=685502 RepID=A0A8H6RD89_9PEZI|nr:putative serine/threonine-protein kinase haspin-like [Pseudocercospora fuligena]